MLTALAIEKAKPSEKPQMLLDGQGLHLLITTEGSKLWRFRYRFGGKQRMISFGKFPDVGLADAREKRAEARKLVAAGIDPSQRRREDKRAAELGAANTFKALTAEYLERLRAQGAIETTVEKNRWLLEDLAGRLADKPITAISSADVLEVLKAVEKTGRRESARRLRGVIGGVFRYAIATLRAENDPTYALRGALLAPKVTHRPAITDEARLGALWAAINDYDGWPTLKAALQLAMLTMCRPGEVRHMTRSEINFAKATWSIPPERMKMRRPHDVPLSRQAMEVLRGVWEMFPQSDLVLPSIRSWKRPLSENALNSALRRMGYSKDEVTAHGFRSSASTILNERGYNSDVIEMALAHQDEDEVRAAYNRARHWPERVKMLQDWADLLDQFSGKSPAPQILSASS